MHAPRHMYWVIGGGTLTALGLKPPPPTHTHIQYNNYTSVHTGMAQLWTKIYPIALMYKGFKSVTDD